MKSAHKVKLTDKQLLQWMVPILLVMLIYLGTWTLSATPSAEVVSIMTIPSTLFCHFLLNVLSTRIIKMEFYFYIQIFIADFRLSQTVVKFVKPSEF